MTDNYRINEIRARLAAAPDADLAYLLGEVERLSRVAHASQPKGDGGSK